MISTVDGSSAKFLADLDRIQSSLSQVQAQMSSGLRVQVPADDPSAVTDILQLSSSLSQSTQVQTNLSIVKSRVDASESAVSSAVSLMDQLTSLAAEGANGILSADSRAAIAQQVRSIQQQLVAISNTSVEGRHVFSGDQPASQAYQLNLSSPTGVTNLLPGVQATAQVQDVTGSSFTIAETAQAIFDHVDAGGNPDASNVFAAVQSLAVALEGNNQSGIDNAVLAIKQANSYLNTQLAFYGSVQNRVAAAVNQVNAYQVQQKTALSARQDADPVQDTVELTQDQTHLQAALAARSKLPTTSLFDYLR
ncbi:MAG: flagellin [Bryobacteraceae bacterium]